MASGDAGHGGHRSGHDNELSVRWQNFRGFEDTGWISLKPITLLIGPNNGGKTSIHAPLSLLKQTLLSRTGQNALLLRGEYLSLGTYSDLVWQHDRDLPITLGVRWHSHARMKELDPVGTYPPGEVELQFIAGDSQQETKLKQYEVRDWFRRLLMRRTAKEDGSYSLRVSKGLGKARALDELSKADRAAIRAARKSIKNAKPIDFLFDANEVRLDAYGATRDSEDSRFPIEVKDDKVRMYCQIADYASSQMRALTHSFYYLGPLRDSPRRIYELSGEMPSEVGIRGDAAPEIIYRWRNDEAQIEEVRKALRLVGADPSFAWEELGDQAFSFYFAGTSPRKRTSFADMGFGMSQILPLIVQGHAAPQDSWIITEQPEIHLNPFYQARLGDLFSSFVKRGVNSIIETHSEHLLLRLRRLVAEEEIDPNDISLLYVESTDSGSKISDIPVAEDGHIDPETWPSGFFGEALEDSLGLAKAQIARSDLD